MFDRSVYSPFVQKLNQVQQGEQENPHNIHKVPVKTGGALEQKQTALAKAVTTRLTRETFDEILKTLEEQWERCDMAVRKQKLSSLIEKIMIQEGAFKIHFRTGI